MKNKKRIIVLIIIVLAILLSIDIWHHYKSVKHAQVVLPPLPVNVATLPSKSLPITVSTSGHLSALNDATITPRAGGYIKAMPFHEGDQVKNGQLLFLLNNQTEKNALASAKAANQLSQLQYQRNKKLLKKGFITQDVLYSSKVTMKQNEASLQTAETNLAERTIRAPFSGTVGSKAVSIGSYVNTGTTLTTLVDSKDLHVTYALPATTLNKIKLGQTVTIVSDTSKNQLKGTVSYISPSIDTATQTISLQAAINNKQGLFKPGEYVTVIQHLGNTQKVMLAPQQSVLASMSGYSVFIVKNNKAVRVFVKTGKQYQGDVTILSGLNPADKVIIAGQRQIHEGQSVVINRENEKS